MSHVLTLDTMGALCCASYRKSGGRLRILVICLLMTLLARSGTGTVDVNCRSNVITKSSVLSVGTRITGQPVLIPFPAQESLEQLVGKEVRSSICISNQRNGSKMLEKDRSTVKGQCRDHRRGCAS